jgi:phage regulator Rha-like protein
MEISQQLEHVVDKLVDEFRKINKENIQLWNQLEEQEKKNEELENRIKELENKLEEEREVLENLIERVKDSLDKVRTKEGEVT